MGQIKQSGAPFWHILADGAAAGGGAGQNYQRLTVSLELANKLLERNTGGAW
jgi:hypothetical protein